VADVDYAVGPLDGVRVVDLTRVLAGPLCTRQLADLGAEVIRIGDPHGTDVMTGASAANVARNKRSVLIDLRQPRGRAVFLRLCEDADVVVENYRPGVKYRLGVGPDAVWSVNPRVVYASISGFGQDGPYADRPGVDLVAQAMSGLMAITGAPGSGPWPAGTALSDIAAGSFLTQGILAALYARERTGRGQYVHTSVFEAAVSFMDPYITRYLIDGDVPAQSGGNPTGMPMGTFRTADGWVVLAAQFDWPGFVAAVDAPGLRPGDARFADARSRARYRDELHAILAQVLRTETTSHWVERLVARGIPACGVDTVAELVDNPQARHLRMIQRLPDGGDGAFWAVRHPVTLEQTPTSLRTSPAEPGQHTDEVLRACGFSAADLAALRASGTVA
jgi:crotonobetainyl-CoA:carnitine CoA-transferase CaiB-like acyl-CoA transferase